MGKLLQLVLYNFKSYRGEHILHFGDSYFTSIIGPNGSGKSNSMDAISFVLGIKSSHLRSTHLKDLVYRGRVLKHSKIDVNGDATDGANGETHGHTNGNAHANGGAEEDGDEDEETDTQTSTQRSDPQTAWVMAVYEDDAGEEQRWKRSITSSGQSEYRINNRVVTAKQYNEALEAENILIKARNFLVFQGDVESIANQNPRDLTRLIEQISGSLEYKAEYERLKAEKEKADEDQANKLTQRRGINGEIKQYQQQKDELDRYESMRDEKDEAIVTHVLWKLFHFQRTIEDSTAEIQKHQEELKEYRRNVQKYEDRLEDAKREQAKVGRDVSKCERDVKRRDKAVEEKQRALEPIDEKLAVTTTKVKNLQKKLVDVQQEHGQHSQSADSWQKKLDTMQKAQKRWEDQWKAEQQNIGRELNDRDLQEYQQLRGEVYKQTGNDQVQATNIKRQLKTDEETVKSLKSTVDSTQTQVDNLDADVNGLKTRRAELSQTIKTTSKDIEAKRNAINAIASERERSMQLSRELDEKLREVLRKLSDAMDQQRESHKETQQRETVAQMKRIFPGVRGMIHHLCKPKQKKYETAVGTAFGRHWDSVVVDSEKVAKDCMGYLKDQRVGRMTFIPLDTIVHSQPNANLRGMHQGMRLAIDTIEFDHNVERAMNFALGSTIVTDTLKIAKHLCYERGVDAKAVALDGTVIHKGGNMTGGQEPTEKKRRFEEADVEKWRGLAENFKNDIDALPKGHKRQAEEEVLQSELSGLEKKLEYAQDELKTLDRNIESKSKELKHLRSQLADVQPKYDEQSRGLDTLRTSLEEHTAAIAEVEDEVFAAFCQRLGYDNIRDYERQQGAMQEEAETKRSEFIVQISQLKNQVAFEKQRLNGTANRVKNLQAEITRCEEGIAEYDAAKEDMGGELDELEAEIEQLGEQLATLRAQYKEREDKVNEARREVQKRSKSVDKTLKEVSALQAEVQQAATQRYGVLRSCKLENIALPLERGSRKLDSLPLEDAILEDESNAMDLDDADAAAAVPSTNDYGIHPDFSDLAEDLQTDSSDETATLLTEKIATLTSTLETLAPNMRSADRLAQTSTRLKATETAFTASRSAAAAATKAFTAIQSKRTALFTKTLNHISKQIGPVYRDLTATPTFPLGGQASLDAEEEAEPYLGGVKYHAMPPLKRFRDMEHLSGGEKTMAALALLFAVHTFAPSPFFVLDEVDAALDWANTGQLARYVQRHAGPGMQFVVISLKSGLFEGSETLVGVMRDQGVNSSKALTLDLRKYQAV